MAIAIMIGIVGRAMSSQGLIDHLSGSDSETVIVKVAHLLSTHGVFPALMAGLILAGILASTMSTADSQLLAASSSVSENILQEALHVNLSKERNMLVARFTVIIIAIFGVIIARDPNSSVFGIVSFAWAGFGAAFGPVVLCALFWKRTTFAGALSGMLAGGISVFVWKYLIAPLGGVFGIYELLPAFLIGLVVIVVVSLLTPAPSQEILDEFDRARSGKEID
jgi:sodium/proline symporter